MTLVSSKVDVSKCCNDGDGRGALTRQLDALLNHGSLDVVVRVWWDGDDVPSRCPAQLLNVRVELGACKTI